MFSSTVVNKEEKENFTGRERKLRERKKGRVREKGYERERERERERESNREKLRKLYVAQLV